MFLNVVETQRENFDDYIKEDFRPIFFFIVILSHKGTINFFTRKGYDYFVFHFRLQF